MSERYSRLFTLSENLYAIGSPVVIAAGALLKDNQTGKIVAQLKLRSISGKAIRAVKVRLNLFDTAGKPIGNGVEYEYLDLNASRDSEFGQKTPVFVAESKARSYEAAVVEVIFADRTTWTENCAEWEPLPKQKTLDAVLINEELIKQYKITVCGNVSYYPTEEKDLWYCTCGALNHKDEHCHVCRRTLFELQNVDMDQLSKDRDARLAQEAADAEAKASAERTAKKKNANILKIVISAVCAIVAMILLITNVIIPHKKYNDAIALMDAGKYEEALFVFGDISNYSDVKDQMKYLWSKVAVRETISAGDIHTVGLKTDGTVVAVGYNYHGQCDVSSWTDIVAISAGEFHTVGLKADGTVVAVGDNDDGQCDVSNWTNIVAIAAGGYHTVGLKADGTLVAAGRNNCYQCDVSGAADIIAIAAGDHHTVALRADGTVGAVGYNEYGQCDVSGWTDIITISAGLYDTIGLKADGTLVAAGRNNQGQCDVSSWEDIVAISAGAAFTVGVKVDGTAISVGISSRCDVSDWTDIVAVSAGGNYTVGLKTDGTVVAVGNNGAGQCDVSDWTDIKIPN